MAKTFQDKIQLSVLVDAQKGINELGKLEMEAKEVANSMRRMKRNSEEFAEAGKKLDAVNERIFQMRQAMEPASMTLNQLSKYQRQLNGLMQHNKRGTESYEAMHAQLVKVNTELRERRMQMRATDDGIERLKKKSDLAGASMKQLAEYQRRLNEELADLPRGTREYQKAIRRMSELSEAIRRQSAEIKDGRIMKELAEDADLATASMERLRLREKKLAEEFAKLKRGTELYDRTVQRLAETQRQLEIRQSEMKGASRFRELTHASDLSRVSLKQLLEYQKRLNAELAELPRGASGYASAAKRMREVDKAVERQQREIRGLGRAWTFLKSEVQQFGMLAIGYLGLQEIASQFSNLIRGMADMSDTMADVKKTTGLSNAELGQLSESLKKIDTRTSKKELLELAKVAGKLGVQGREDIEGFVRAGDQIAVALGEDLGGNAEEAIRQVGKLVDIFKVKEEFGLEQGLLKVGSAINSLGAASTANEGYMVDFAKRLGGIAPNANISIDQVLGLGATLDQLGQSSESSSTALGQLLVSLAQDMPAFARIAGISVQHFANILARDANYALIKVLEGSKSTSGGLAGMASTLTKLGVDGARAASVVGVLSNNIELLKEQQKLAYFEFARGNSIAKEFAVKNDTLAGALEKVQKRIKAAFMESGFVAFLQNAVRGIEEVTRANEDLSNGLRDQEKELVKTMNAFNAEMTLLRTGNLTVQERDELMFRINKKYGELLPSMVTEKMLIGELNTLHAQGLVIMKQQILMKTREADLAERMNKLARAELENERDKQALLDAKIKAEIERAKAPTDATSMMVGTGLTGGYAQKETPYGQAVRRVEEIERRIRLREEEIRKLQESIDYEDELYQKIIKRSLSDPWEEKEEAPKPKTGKAPISYGKGKASDAKSELDRLREQWEAFKERVDRMSAEMDVEEAEGYEKDWIRLNDKYSRMKETAKEFHKSGVVSYREYKWMLREIDELHQREDREAQARHREKAEAEEEKKREEDLRKHKEFLKKKAEAEAKAKADALKREIDLWNARASMLSEFSQLITATNQLIATQGGKQTEFQKQLALVQIGIDTASSIAKAIAGATAAAASTGPAAPFALTGYIVSMTASVIAAVAKARTILKGSNVPEKPSFYQGGYTGSKPIGIDSEGRGIAGDVHVDEYVVPKWLLLQNPKVADMVSIIEGFRTRRLPQQGFQQAQALPQQAIAPTAVPSLREAGIAESLDRFSDLVDRIERTGIKAYFDRRTAEDADEYLADIERNFQDSRL